MKILLLLLSLISPLLVHAVPGWETCDSAMLWTLKKSTPQPTLFQGKALYSNRAHLSFPYEAVINFISIKNARVHGAQMGENGNTVHPGTLIASVISDVYKSSVETAELEVSVAERVRSDAILELKRQRTMKEKQATSEAAYDNAVSALISANLRFAIAKQKVVAARTDYGNCFIYAPFTGIVDEVYVQNGSSTKKGEPIAILSCTSPMRVVVPMDPGLTAEMSQTYAVKVLVGAAAQPLEGWVDARFIYSDRIEIFVNNPMVEHPEISSSNAQIKRVEGMALVPYFRSLNGQPGIGVPQAAIVKEKDSFFVFKGKGLHFSNENKMLPRIFQVEKIGITPYDMFRYSGPYYHRSVSSACGLKSHDLVVLNPKNLQDLDTVILSDNRPLIRNQDDVVVSIPQLACEGFYVPVEAISYSLNEPPSINVQTDSGIEKIAVKIRRRYQEQIQIEAPELCAGMKLRYCRRAQINNTAE